jgi:hypothetical protein
MPRNRYRLATSNAPLNVRAPVFGSAGACAAAGAGSRRVAARRHAAVAV